MGMFVVLTANNDPPQQVISDRLLGTALRTTFAHTLCSINDGMLKQGLTYAILGVKLESQQPVEQDGSTMYRGNHFVWKIGQYQTRNPAHSRAGQHHFSSSFL